MFVETAFILSDRPINPWVRVAAALEYNAAVTRFRERMAAGEGGPDPVI